LQGHTIDDDLDLEFEPDQDEMNGMDEAEECIKDIENLFNQRRSESIEMDIGNTCTEGEDETANSIGAKVEVKDVKRIDMAGRGKEGDAKNEEEAF
jgi:hypothetical protein